MTGTGSIGSSLTVHILVTLLIGVLLPSLPFALYADGAISYQSPGLHALVGAAAAVAAAIVLLRRFSEFPGTAIFHYTLPVYSTAFGVMIAIILGLRIDYSNSVIAAAFVASLSIQYVLIMVNQRFGEVSYYVVPGGRMEQFRLPAHLPVQRLTSPRVPLGRDRIVVADLHHDHDPAWEHAIAQAALNDIPVYHYKQVWETITGRVQIEHLSENNFGSLLPSAPYRNLKRVLDLLICLMVLPLLAPLMLVVAALIRLDSPGSAFFLQKRIGHRGRTFRVVKFRTMRITTEPDEPCERTLAMTRQDDDRITRIGHFLRRSRIDELPQIINILRGDMSWIGPRPEAIALSSWYESEIPFYSYRHIVRPGITGWAQVNQGHVTNIADVDAKLQYDFFYIKNFSHWMDMLIVLRTIRVMLTGFGAK